MCSFHYGTKLRRTSVGTQTTGGREYSLSSMGLSIGRRRRSGAAARLPVGTWREARLSRVLISGQKRRVNRRNTGPKRLVVWDTFFVPSNFIMKSVETSFICKQSSTRPKCLRRNFLTASEFFLRRLKTSRRTHAPLNRNYSAVSVEVSPFSRYRHCKVTRGLKKSLDTSRTLLRVVEFCKKLQ